MKKIIIGIFIFLGALNSKGQTPDELFNQGLEFYNQGLYSKAEPFWIDAKGIREKVLGKEHPDYANACQYLALLYKEQGLYSKAEFLNIEARNIRGKVLGKGHPDYASSCHNLAVIYRSQDLNSKAELLYLEAKGIRERVLGKAHPDYASSCNNLAILYRNQGLYSKAEILYIEAKNIRENVLGKDNLDYASSCNNLAVLYRNQGLYSKAETLYIEAKDIRLKLLGKDHPDYAASCNNLAILYRNQGLYSKAEPLYIEAKDIRLKLLGKDHLNYAASCNNLAVLYRYQGLYSKAEALYIDAKNIREKILGKDHTVYTSSCYNLALLYSAQGQYNKAGFFYEIATANKLKQIDELLPTLSEKEKEEYYKSIAIFFTDYYDFVLKANKPNLYADLFNLQLCIKGLIFQSTQKMYNQIMNSGNSALIQKFETWKTQRKTLNSYMQLPLAEKAKKGLNTDSLTALINELEKALSKESELFASAVNKKLYAWKDIQKKLLPNEAAVEIIRTDSAYIALIVTPTTKNNPEAVILSNGIELEKRLIKYYRTSITNKIEDELSYVNFWLPIKEKLGNASNVYVSADGVYHQLNLLTLKNPTTKKYIIDETNIQLLSNLRDLLTFNPNEVAQRYENYKIHLIAYPKYDGGALQNKNGQLNIHDNLKSDTTQRFFDWGGKITMLPGTKKEAGNILTVCKKQNIKTEVMLLEKATEEYIKSLNNPTVLHIATHGFFMPSEEISDRGSGLSGEEGKVYTKDPLLNSGLLFANAQQGLSGTITEGEDGVLTAKEALNLNLDKTELVIMSACETGLGEIRNGEGVYGLQRSFQQAGAKTIIISLWKVSDEATQALMSTFYNNLLAKKMSKREAFKQAQASLMLKYPEPYYWGAFVMVGE